MKINVEVVYYANAVRMSFLDVEKAKAAYEKIKAALTEYRRFKNDAVEIVEVDGEAGVSAFKLEHMDAVLFNNGTEDEAHIRRALQEEKLTRSLREEYGLPEYPDGRSR